MYVFIFIWYISRSGIVKSYQVISSFLNYLSFITDSVTSSFYNLDKSLLWGIWFANIFSHFVGCLITFLIIPFTVQNILILMNLIYLFFLCYVTSKKPLPNPGSQMLTPMFYSKSTIVLSLTLYMIHFELIFVYGVKKSNSLACG